MFLFVFLKQAAGEGGEVKPLKRSYHPLNLLHSPDSPDGVEAALVRVLCTGELVFILGVLEKVVVWVLTTLDGVSGGLKWLMACLYLMIAFG